MKKLILYLLTFITSLFLSANELFDTGYITWEQPNQVTFTAREWSDGFFWWMETNTGYRIVQDDDGYYYYAELDTRGEYIASSYKVGIDSPPQDSYLLERSADRIACPGVIAAQRGMTA